MSESNRLFFALWPDDASRAACDEVARDLKVRMQPDGYMIRPERYHMTLPYLGDKVLPEQEATAMQVAHLANFPPFTLTLEQAASFRGAKVWVLTPQQMPPELQLLHDGLRDALRAAGVVPERMRFTPHLTVVRKVTNLLPPTRIKPVVWAVKEFVLIRSLLDCQPVEYQLLGRWPLNGVMPVKKPPPQMNLWEN